MPITPATVAVEAVGAGHAFVCALNTQQLGLAMSICQSFALDNGAFPAWRSGKPITDWNFFYEMVSDVKRHPSFDFAVIPDVIDGGEEENDVLVYEWPHGTVVGAPVWHMHESLDRLLRLARKFHRVCLGSSGQYATVGNAAWWGRMLEAMDVVCDDDGYPICKLHGLRMLNPKVFTKLPLSSADSTNIARNVGIDKNWARGAYLPPTKEARARLMRARIEHHNSLDKWDYGPVVDIVSGDSYDLISVGISAVGGPRGRFVPAS